MIQVSEFAAAVRTARHAGLRPELPHLANSAAGLDAPRTHYDLVRAGVGPPGDLSTAAAHRRCRPLAARLLRVAAHAPEAASQAQKRRPYASPGGHCARST